VLGKVLSQAAQTLSLAVLGWPLLAFFGAAAGLEPSGLFALAATLLVHVVALAGLGMVVAVWSRTTAQAVLRVYCTGALLYLGLWALGREGVLQPLYVVNALLEEQHEDLWRRLRDVA
jgi:hypothetical protein